MPGEKEGNDETERVEEKLANPKEKNSVNLEQSCFGSKEK